MLPSWLQLQEFLTERKAAQKQAKAKKPLKPDSKPSKIDFGQMLLGCSFPKDRLMLVLLLAKSIIVSLSLAGNESEVEAEAALQEDDEDSHPE